MKDVHCLLNGLIMKNSAKVNSGKGLITSQRQKRLLNTKNSLKQSSDVLVVMGSMEALQKLPQT